MIFSIHVFFSTPSGICNQAEIKTQTAYHYPFASIGGEGQGEGATLCSDSELFLLFFPA
jgi:hypothetical protein